MLESHIRNALHFVKMYSISQITKAIPINKNIPALAGTEDSLRMFRMATDSGCLSEIIPGNDTFVLLIYGNSYEFLKTVIKKLNNEDTTNASC